jgi:NTP pyrophosphatase (non-canonical NTP hydrolase)
MTALGATTPRDHAINAIRAERHRQIEKWGHGPMPAGRELAILVEEVGEVATAIQDGDIQNLRDELVQVAAVCVRWLEFLDVDSDEDPPTPCEGCRKPSTTEDSEGVPLCADCYGELVREAEAELKRPVAEGWAVHRGDFRCFECHRGAKWYRPGHTARCDLHVPRVVTSADRWADIVKRREAQLDMIRRVLDGEVKP